MVRKCRFLLSNSILTVIAEVSNQASFIISVVGLPLSYILFFATRAP